VWDMSSKGSIEGKAFIDALSDDNEVRQYLSRSELNELTNTDYYIKYIDTAFARLGL
jgi:adenylosuccinate lyase